MALCHYRQGMSQPLTGFYLGRRPYAPIHVLMRELFEARRAGDVKDLVLLLEHDPVITLGRGAKEENLLANAGRLQELGVHLEETGRGGDVTLHAPGQLIAYPIIDLNPDRCDVRKYVRALTDTMKALVKPYGIEGGTIEKLIGLWVDPQNLSEWAGEEHVQNPMKIGAIGVRISRWITQHGFALNLSTDLSYFNLIVPCGIQEHGVCSVKTLTGEGPSVPSLARSAHAELDQRLGTGDGQFIDAEAKGTEELLPFIKTLFASV